MLSEYSIVEFEAPDFVQNVSIANVNIRAKHGITIIAIKRQDEEGGEIWNINPNPSDVIRKDDTLVVLGSNADIEKFSALK